MKTTKICILLLVLFGFLSFGNATLPAQEVRPGLDVSELDQDSYSLAKKLFNAALRSGDLQVCSDLLGTGKVYINDTDNNGMSPLFLAAAAGDVPMCKLLLENGANPSQTIFIENPVYTPLEVAIANDRTEAALILIEATDPKALMPEKGRNQPAVFYAILNENAVILNALIQKGADVNAPEKIGRLTQTPLYFAACLGNVELCRILFEAGAKFDFRFEAIRASDALFVAALSNNVKLCQFFIEKKVDLNVRQNEKCTVLHELIRRDKPHLYSSKTDLFPLNRSPFRIIGPFNSAFFPKDDPYIEYDDEDDDEDEEEPPETARRAKTVELCKLFLEAGANPNLRDASGTSPLEVVFLSQMEELRSFEKFQSLIDLLLAAKADLNAKDRNGWTALNYCVFYSFMAPPPPKKDATEDNGEEEDGDEGTKDVPGPTIEQRIALFQKLLDAGADIQTVDNKGNTILHFAAAAPGKEVTKSGIEMEISYETRDHNREYCRKLIELMIEKGCSISTKNKAGETPLDWAMQGGPNRPHKAGGFGGGMGGGVSPSASPVDLMMR